MTKTQWLGLQCVCLGISLGASAWMANNGPYEPVTWGVAFLCGTATGFCLAKT